MPRLERKHSLATRTLSLGQRADPGRHDLERPADLLGQRRLRDPPRRRHARSSSSPTGSTSAVTSDHGLAEGMAWHFAFMWFFAINGLLYVAVHLLERRVA